MFRILFDTGVYAAHNLIVKTDNESIKIERVTFYIRLGWKEVRRAK